MQTASNWKSVAFAKCSHYFVTRGCPRDTDLEVQSPCRLSNCIRQFVLRLSVFELRLQQERLGRELLRHGGIRLRGQISPPF